MRIGTSLGIDSTASTHRNRQTILISVNSHSRAGPRKRLKLNSDDPSFLFKIKCGVNGLRPSSKASIPRFPANVRLTKSPGRCRGFSSHLFGRRSVLRDDAPATPVEAIDQLAADGLDKLSRVSRRSIRPSRCESPNGIVLGV